MLKQILCGTAIAVMLTACGIKPEQAVEAVEAGDADKLADGSADGVSGNAGGDFDQHLAFESEYLPIVEKAIKELFSDVSKFEPFGTYYIDDAQSDQKIVFLLDRPDAEEVKQLQKVLQEEMGDKVEFRVSVHSQEELGRAQDEITEMLQGMKLKGGWSVGADIRKQKVVVEAYLTVAQRSQLINKYGADLVEVRITGIVTAMVGYVVKEKDGKILVADSNVKDFGAQGGESYFYNASWFSNVPSDVRVGQKVEVKVIEGFTTMQYPGDQTAEEVIILPGSKPEKAALSEEEAIRKALASDEYQQSAYAKEWLPVVQETKYDESRSTWTVYFTNEGTDKVISIQVKDH